MSASTAGSGATPPVSTTPASPTLLPDRCSACMPKRMSGRVVWATTRVPWEESELVSSRGKKSERWGEATLMSLTMVERESGWVPP